MAEENVSIENVQNAKKNTKISTISEHARDFKRVRSNIIKKKYHELGEQNQALHKSLTDEHERRTRPSTYEMTSTLQSIHEALPEGAVKTIIERLQKPLKFGTRTVDFFGRTYDRALMALVLYALRGPAYYALGTPPNSHNSIGIGNEGMEFRNIRAGRPLVLLGFQPRLEMLPVAIVAAMMPRFRQWRARQTAITLEAFAKSSIGQKTIKKVDQALGDRVEKAMKRFDSILKTPDNTNNSVAHGKDSETTPSPLGENQVFEATAKAA